MNNEIVTLNVPNAPALQVSGEYVILKPFCEAIGLDYSAQYRRVKRMEEEGSIGIAIMATPSNGGTQGALGIHKDDFRLWLLGIDTNRMANEEAAEMIITYKREVKQVLKDYYEKGVAVNPRLDPKYQAEVLQILKGLLPEDRMQKRAEIIAARVMGDAPEVKPEEMPLYVETYLDEKDRSDISSSGFGRKLANLFRNTTGEEPPLEPAQIHGRMRTAKAYKESHRPLFDQVLATYAAK